MKFKKQILQEMACGHSDEEFKIISHKICDTDRWSINYEMIFEHEGKTYMSCYSEGATEQQDEHAYKDYDDEIEVIEVFAVEKTATVYGPAPKTA